MMNSTSKSLFKVRPGTIIEGKWHKKRYILIKELGFGANGIVYLAKSNNKQVALKMSDNNMTITSEVNVLKSFGKVQGLPALGPSLIDVDDWLLGNNPIPFYAMEYIEGPDFLTFIHQQGKEWVGVLMLQLLNDLQFLHRQGWVFGDLKPENLIVTGPPPRIRCIDVGGTTMQGRAIKEYTEFYDRGYWGLGNRKAEPSYDLFAVAMIWIHTEYPHRFNRTSEGRKQLEQMVKQKSSLAKYERVLLNALTGKYKEAEEMRVDILEALRVSSKGAKSSKHRKGNAPSLQNRNYQQLLNGKKQKGNKMETVLILMIILLLYLLYIFAQLPEIS